MDESSTNIAEDSPSSSRPKPRQTRLSFSSQTSTGRSRSSMRLKTPIPHSRPSVINNGLETEILAPVPRKHHNLQVSESMLWLGSPTFSALSSRPVSPMSLSTAGGSPVLARRRLSHKLSFSSLMEQSSPRLAHAPRVKHREHGERGGGMGKRWVRWMHRHGCKQWVAPSALLAALWVRWAIGLGSYSGQDTPPMFGDYEAQRHWMELTIHLPPRQWYTYDLQYWGLDYPPLTAYVSWLCGIVGSWIDPSWFALDASRGIESEGSKVYLRSTVLFFDTLVYLPALWLFVRTWLANRSARTQESALLLLLFQPSLLLIDFGHFQYNSVMLGFTLLALNFFETGRDLLGASCFVLSLGFKQMALYFAPAIGSYLLGKCLYLGPAQGTRLFLRLAIVTTLSVLLLFLPFLPPFAPLPAILDPITRIFPFARGLFEDKVANFWCASDVLLKWRRRLSAPALMRLSTLLTALGFLPGAAGLIYGGWRMRIGTPPLKSPGGDGKSNGEKSKGEVGVAEESQKPAPTLALLPYALLTSSMSFFLFSFQVHEKTILLPLLPLTLLLSGASAGEGSETFELGMLVSNVAVFSMWPLLKRDGLGVPYVALTLLWNRLAGYNPFRACPNSMLQYVSLLVHAASLGLHVLELLFSPPARYPDLFPVLNVLLSTPVFALTWLWSIRRGMQVGWALGGPSSRTKDSKPAAATEKSARHDDKMQGGHAQVTTSSANSIGREAGMWTTSLGYAQGRRRHVPRNGRSASISSVVSGTS